MTELPPLILISTHPDGTHVHCAPENSVVVVTDWHWLEDQNQILNYGEGEVMIEVITEQLKQLRPYRHNDEVHAHMDELRLERQCIRAYLKEQG